MSGRIAKRVIYEGRVQGVGFRYTAKDLARGFDVCGSVMNLPDGTVELEVMGEVGEVDRFLHEIAVESAVAHHIRSVRVEVVGRIANPVGFRIIR